MLCIKLCNICKTSMSRLQVCSRAMYSSIRFCFTSCRSRCGFYQQVEVITPSWCTFPAAFVLLHLVVSLLLFSHTLAFATSSVAIMRAAVFTLSQGSAGVEAASKPSATRNGMFSGSRATKPLTFSDTFFLYTNLSGEVIDEQSCGQVNTYVFSPASFANVEYPSTWPTGRTWPPQTVEDLCCEPGLGAGDCVGDNCYTDDRCVDSDCDHTLDVWKQATQDWQQYFELRETGDRGIGVFTKRAFKQDEVLGWYTGALKPDCRGSYGLAMAISSMPRTSENLKIFNAREHGTKPLATATMLTISKYNGRLEEEVMIDARTVGNWTRFINHSCDAYTGFLARRVGPVRISVIQATKYIPADVELTVDYGRGYFKYKTCLCGAVNCLENWKEKIRDAVSKGVESTSQSNELEMLENGMADVQI